MKTTIIRKGIVLSVLAALVFLSCIIFISGNFVAQAASYSESESNNSKDTANQIAVNTSVSGNLSTSSDVDWYKFTTTQDGYFNVEFTHTFLSSSYAYWSITLYDESGVNGIVGGTDNIFTSDGNANASSWKYGISAGTYYVQIKSSYRYSSNNYTVKINFTATSNWETENNNTMNTADVIYLNKSINGSIPVSSDVDWYVFEITQNGYINIRFEHTFLSSSYNYWRIYLYDSSGVNNITGGMDNYISAQGNANASSWNYGVPAGKYYIKVIDDHHSGNDYSLKVNFTAASDWETENNNNKNSADEIEVNEGINGAISTSDDVDWYRFSISSTSQIALVFNHEVVDSSIVLWHIYLYDNTGVTLLNKFSVNGNEASRASDYISVSSETCYIKITPHYYSYMATDYSGVDYSLCIVEKHEHVGTWSTAKPATCLEGGTINRTCTICGVIETQETEPLGHDYVGVQTKEATITQKGETTFTCSRCGDSYTESDGSKLWVIPVICIVGVLVLIGVINYIRIVRKRH